MSEYQDYYFKSGTLLLVDVFEDFRKMCLEIYKLDPAKSLSTPRLAWKATLTKRQSKIRVINWYWHVIIN